VTGQRGIDIRALYAPRIRTSYGKDTPSAGFSDLSASLVNLPVIHESSPDMCRSSDVSEVDSHAPYPIQIGVRTQSEQMADHGTVMMQQTDVGHAQDRATPVPATVILPRSLDTGEIFLYREKDPPHSSWVCGSERPAPPHNTNAAAALNLWNGTSASPGQPNACPAPGDSKRMQHVTPLSGLQSHALRPPFPPIARAYNKY